MNITNDQFYKKNTKKLDEKVNSQQNIVCLEQQIYASPENFRQSLLVMLKTLRMLVFGHILKVPSWSLWFDKDNCY